MIDLGLDDGKDADFEIWRFIPMITNFLRRVSG